MMGVRRMTARSGVPPSGLRWSLWQTRAPLLGCLLLSSALAQAQDSPEMFEATEATEAAEAGLQTERAPRVGLRVVPSLTLAQTFVQQHQGTIECDSVPGRTLFKILIPLP